MGCYLIFLELPFYSITPALQSFHLALAFFESKKIWWFSLHCSLKWSLSLDWPVDRTVQTQLNGPLLDMSFRTQMEIDQLIKWSKSK